MALMVSVSGIRGIVGTDLNPQNLVTFTAAYGTWLGGGAVVLGRDTRRSGPVCEEIVAATLQSVGCDVIRIGVTPTPTVAMEVLRHSAAGGIIITASHNPAEWNALKMLNSRSEFLDAEQGKEVIELSKSGKFNWKSYDRLGSVRTVEDAIDRHIEAILSLPYIDAEQIAGADFTVAVDAVNGAGSIALPRLLERLGVRVHPLNCTPDGNFPHNPEPLPEHLGQIRQFMKETPCNLGLVTDPDADRLALLDEKGELFGEELTQVAAFDFILSRRPGPVVTNLSSSRAADDIAARHGQTCHRSAVGEINVVKRMQQTGAVIGGEGNGGVINPDLHYGRDALVGAAMVLQLLAERKISASAYRAELPDYRIIKEKIALDDLGMEAGQVLERLETVWAARQPDTTDGVKIDFEQGWVHFRKSNTEPIVRLYAEAKSEEEARTLAEEVLAGIRN